MSARRPLSRSVRLLPPDDFEEAGAAAQAAQPAAAGVDEVDALHLARQDAGSLGDEYLAAIGAIGDARGDVHGVAKEVAPFADGVAADYDVVIAATGFTISFPFFDEGFVDYSGLEVPLYLKVFHPQHRNLFFIGLVQPQGCIWPLAEQQARLVTAFLKGEWRYPEDIEARIARELATPDHHWMKTPRHSVEVDYHAYRARLAKELAGARAY